MRKKKSKILKRKNRWRQGKKARNSCAKGGRRDDSKASAFKRGGKVIHSENQKKYGAEGGKGVKTATYREIVQTGRAVNQSRRGERVESHGAGRGTEEGSSVLRKKGGTLSGYLSLVVPK